MRTPFRLLVLLFTLNALASSAPPVADAGVDNTQFQECTGAGVATFQLNGSGSTDPEGGALTYTWTGPFGVATGVNPTVLVPLGVHEITLSVKDPDGETAEDTFTAITIDTRPPSLEVALSPSQLPPYNQHWPITATVTVEDACGAGSSFVLDSVTDSAEAPESVIDASPGSPDLEFSVFASLTHPTLPRIYSATYTATDSSGNQTSVSGLTRISPKLPVFFADPDLLSFDYTIGGEVPPAQQALVGALVFSSFKITGAPGWLQVTPSSGETQAEIEVSVDPEGLEPGIHNATLAFESGAGLVDTVRVRLTVRGQPKLFSLPESLTLEYDLFTGEGGKVETPAQAGPVVAEVFIGARDSVSTLTLSTTTPWLQVSADSPRTPATVLIGAVPAGLGRGVHQGSVIVSSDNPESEPLRIPVELRIDSSVSFMAPEFVVNSATMERRPVAPGSLVTAFLFNPDGVEASADGLPLPTTLGGLSGDVDGSPVFFVHVSPTQINMQLPDDLGTGVRFLNLYQGGELVARVPLQVVPAAPGIFSFNGQALALNQEGSINGPGAPAASNGVVSLFLTGQGRTNPPAPAGVAAPSDPLALPVEKVKVFVDGQVQPHLFAGLAPGQAGLLQVNVSTAGLAPGTHRVVVEIGAGRSNPGLIYVGQ